MGFFFNLLRHSLLSLKHGKVEKKDHTQRSEARKSSSGNDIEPAERTSLTQRAEQGIPAGHSEFAQVQVRRGTKN